MINKATDMPGYRHEMKYYINYMDYVTLSSRLRAALSSDKNADENGEYFIRSLYFDDITDSAFRDKLDGVNERDKYRIRAYNMRETGIKLERKHKEGRYIRKQSLNLSLDEYNCLRNGDASFLYGRDEPFALEMYIQFKTRIMLPRVIVDYTREPYTFPYEDVRITFDKDLRTGYRRVDMFDASLPTYPVLERGRMILEVKFNNALPAYISTLLQIRAPLHCAVSKYIICRQFEL